MAEGERVRQGTPAQRLGAALRELQQRSGRTLRALEREVLISDSSLSRYFRGSTVPPWPVVRDLCRALGADPAGYRALWEAADRAQGRPAGPGDPAPAAHGTDPAARSAEGGPAPGGAAGEPESGPVPGTAPGRPPRRWAWAAAGAVSGIVAGALLTALAASYRAPAAPGGRPAAEAAGEVDAGRSVEPSRLRRVFVSRQTGRCLDDSLDERLRTFKCNGMSYQWWTAHAETDGHRRLANHATGRCLEDTAAGPRAVRCAPDRPAAQEWRITVWDDESVEVRSRATGRCLDDSGAGLRTLRCDRTDRQRWG
ncbi:helix-turn-helix domain-containing protein [Streptomyces fradiae]|uniref:helix-turn-helix domain-containing protein n=2 Tax=Streptomyces fradiae TaxID=1906 RepID=UPI0033D09682